MPPFRHEGLPGDRLAASDIDLRSIFDEGTWSPFQKWVLFLVSMLIVLDGLDTQTLTLALPAITAEWGVGRSAFGAIIALSFVAMAVGTALGGMIGDRYGRRFALIASAVVFGAATLAGAFAYDVNSLGLTRIAAAAGLGAAMPNATAMVAEYTPLRSRNLALAIAMGSVPIGAFAGGMLAAAILPHGGWRDLFLVSGLIPLAGAMFLFCFLPESPRFLLARKGGAARIAGILRRMGHRVASGCAIVDTSGEAQSRAGVADLFQARFRRDTIALGGAFFLVIFANIFLVSWSPSLLADLGHDLRISSSAAASYSIGGLFGAIMGAVTIDRLGSKHGFAALIGCGIAALAVLAVLPMASGKAPAALLLGSFFVAGIFVPAIQVLLFSLAGQAFPTSVRATGVGFSAAMGRVGAVASGLAGAGVLAMGQPSFFAVVAVSIFGAGLFLWTVRVHIPPRTHGVP